MPIMETSSRTRVGGHLPRQFGVGGKRREKERATVINITTRSSRTSAAAPRSRIPAERFRKREREKV